MTDRVAWQAPRKRAFTERFHFEIQQALDRRESLAQKWRDWLELYRAPDSLAVGYTPIEGASRRTYPLAAMNVDPILARYMRTLHAPQNLWTCAALNERWVDTAKPLQDYLQWIDKRILKMLDVNYRVLLETLKLGTGIYKTGWRFEQRPYVGYDAQGKRTRYQKIVSQPTVDQVHLANFLMPTEARAIDPDAQGGAMWVAERLRFRPERLRELAVAQEPLLPNFDPEAVKQIDTWEENNNTEHEQTVQQLDRLSDSLAMTWRRPVELWEVHARFDTTGNGFEDDIEVLFHLPTMTIVRALYSRMPFRPYSAIRYLRGDGFFGIGVCEQAEMFQSVSSQLLNFNIDRLLFANAPMLAVREGANILPNEPIFPGKIWSLQNPKDDIQSLFLASPGSFDINSVMGMLFEAAKQRTGVTDLQFGSIGAVPSRTPATTIQSLLQEGNTRFDMSIQDLRETGLSEVGLRVLQNLQFQATNVSNPQGQQFAELAAMVLGQPEGQFVAQKLLMPVEPIEVGIGVQLTATSGSNNQELQKQSFLALMQIVNQQAPLIVQMAQIAMQAAGTPLGATAVQLLQGQQELMTRLLEQFNIRNPEEIIVDAQALFGQVQAAGPGAAFAAGNAGGLDLAPQA